MALVLADRVQDVTLTTGTGTITLAGTPPTGFQSFAVIGNGNTTYYTISGGSDWEVGIGTYISASTALSRDTVLSSSNNGNLVNFGAGEKTVFVTYPAEKSVNEDAAGNVNISITGNAATASVATNLYDGAAGSIPYQTGANTTSFVAAASGVLVGGSTPAFSTTPTLTGTNFSAIPNSALSNNTITIGTTGISLGATSLTLAGLTSVTLTQDPTLALQAATKQYVDSIAAEGVSYHTPVKYEVPIALTATYNNGTAGVGATLTNAGTQTAFTPDGVVAQVGDRILIYNQANQVQNGVYTVTTVGDGSTNWVLTRATDANSYGVKDPNKLGAGDAFFVTSGDTGAGETYVCNTAGTITFGTTNITFVQVSSAQIYSAGTGLTLTGTQFSLTVPVATTLGGTGLTTFGAANRALYSSGTTTLTAGTLPTAAGGTGHTSYTDGQILIGKSSDGSLEKANLTAGTSISITNGSGAITITNTAPDQVVSLTGGGTTVITGSYPNFNITSADQYVGTVTSVSATTDTVGTDVAVAVTNATTTPAIAISIPSASASARGALTSSDWSTFNAKQTALVSGTNIKTINGSSILGSGDLSTLNTPLAVVGNSTAGAEIRLPEDTDNGSNYVALKAPNSLASNLTLTLPTADGTSGQVLQTDGSGQLSFATASSGTQTFTSSGSITAGQAVSINSNGTVSKTTGVLQSTVYEYNTSYSPVSAGSFDLGSYYDADTGWHFTGFIIGSAVQLASVKINSSGVITNYNILNISAPSVGSAYNRGTIIKDPVSGKIIFGIAGQGSIDAYIVAVTFNSSTGVLTNSGSINIGNTSNNGFAFDLYYDTFASRIVAVRYIGSGTGTPLAAVDAYSYNGSSFTSTASATFTTGTYSLNSLCAAYNSTANQGRVFYSDASGNGITRTITLNSAGTSCTLSSGVTFFGGQFLAYSRAGYFPSIDRFVTQVIDGGNLYTILINPSTGAAVTSNTTSPANNGAWSSYGFTSSYDTTNNKLWSAGSNSTTAYVWNYTFTASAITYNGTTSQSFGQTFNRRAGISFDATNQRGLVNIYDATNAYTRLIGYVQGSSTTTANNFVGFATQSVSTGQTVTVTVLGGVNTNQTSLTTGSAYYLQYDGSLTTTPTGYGIVARALSATSIQVTTGGAFKELISQTVISGSPTTVVFTLPSGYSQFELTFQYVRGGTSAGVTLTATSSAGSAIGWEGRGIQVLGTSSVYNQTGNTLSLTGSQNNANAQPFGGSLLLQSSSSGAYWSYQMMTFFYNGANGYFGSAGYSSDAPASLTFGGIGTLSNGGVITLYGVG